jgi:ribonucleotide monophosphatase NagD (HAD superfamily)
MPCHFVRGMSFCVWSAAVVVSIGTEDSSACAASMRGGLSLSDAFVIGDKPCDIQLGHNIGGTTVLIRTAGEEQARNAKCERYFIARDLLEAARLIEECFNGEAASEDPTR